MVELEEEGTGGFLGHLFHAAVGTGAQHHQRVRHACAPRRGHLALRVRPVMGTRRTDEHRHTQLIAQHGGRKVSLRDVPQEPGTQRQFLEGGPVAPGGEHIHGPGVDGVPIVVGQHQPGPFLVVVKIDGVQSHLDLPLETYYARRFPPGIGVRAALSVDIVEASLMYGVAPLRASPKCSKGSAIRNVIALKILVR